VASHIAAVVFGIVVKTIFDYWRESRLIQKRREYEMERESTKWKTEVQRAISDVNETYFGVNPKDVDSRREFHDYIEQLRSDLTQLYEERPPHINPGFSQQLEIVIEEAEDFIEIEPKRKPRRIRNDPIGETPKSREHYQAIYDKWTRELRTEINNLDDMIDDDL